MSRPRLAYYSPLPPQKSGIADYSAELLPHLAEHCEIELVVDEWVRPTLARDFPVHGHRDLPGLVARGNFDAVLYHVGNNADYHAEIVRTLREVPGIVVLHEFMLHHLVRGMTLGRGGEGAAGYVEAMRYCYGPTGEALARRSVETGIPLDVWSYPLFEPVVDASLGLIVHNATTRDRVLASRPDFPIALVPHHLSLGGLPKPGSLGAGERAALRRSLGIEPDAIVFASFGFITPAKRLEVSLRAFARLRREVPNVQYLLVGEVSPHYDFAARLPPELADGVVPIGRTELDRFLQYMAACDVAVNLRYPTAGETSGTLIRLLGMGKPVVVSRLGAFAEIPDDACAKIDLDEHEEDLLHAVLHRLATDSPFRERMGENARRHLAEHHTLAGSARGYAEFIRARIAAGGGAQGDTRPIRVVPPLAPYPKHDLVAELTRIVGAEAFDLGVEEGDEEVLEALAETFRDLGW